MGDFLNHLADEHIKDKISDYQPASDSFSFTDDLLLNNEQLDHIIHETKQLLEKTQASIQQKQTTIEKHNQLNAQWIKHPVLSNFSLDTFPVDTLDHPLIGKLDTAYRFPLFWLAIHYFEAHWLIEVNNVYGKQLSYSKKNVLARFHRYAMLTPCFVSTLFSAPQFFRYCFANDDFRYFN